MDYAAKLLVLGGILNLAFGLLVGLVLGVLRSQDPESAQRYLLTAHKAGLQQCFMLFGLVFAVMLSPLAAVIENIAAWILLASTALLDISAVINWRQGVADEFKERSAGLQIGGISGLLAIVGVAILFVGVLQGL